MSRSYKKHPMVRIEKKDCRLLNRQVRRQKLAEIPKGAFYRKMFSDGNWDWRYPWTREQAMQDYNTSPWKQKRYTLEEWMRIIGQNAY